MNARNDTAWVAETGRKYLRGGPWEQNSDTPMWPERNMGDRWRAGAVEAEVTKALARPEHSVCPPAVVRRPPSDQPPEGWSLKEAAATLKISRPALLFRIRRHGFRKAIAMGNKLKSAYASPLRG